MSSCNYSKTWIKRVPQDWIVLLNVAVVRNTQERKNFRVIEGVTVFEKIQFMSPQHPKLASKLPRVL
jgi:hypothetical protein